MRLSIITVNYNNCAGLRRTLDSVAAQTCREFEFLVIDGGSTDGSADLLRAGGGFVDYWVSEVDRGVYHAMNKGVQAAHGDYVLFLNKHYLKWQDTPLRTLFHFVSYSLYDRNLHEVTKGNNYFTCMNLEKEAKLSKASRKSSSKIASEIIKSIDK